MISIPGMNGGEPQYSSIPPWLADMLRQREEVERFRKSRAAQMAAAAPGSISIGPQPGMGGGGGGGGQSPMGAAMGGKTGRGPDINLAKSMFAGMGGRGNPTGGGYMSPQDQLLWERALRYSAGYFDAPDQNAVSIGGGGGNMPPGQTPNYSGGQWFLPPGWSAPGMGGG